MIKHALKMSNHNVKFVSFIFKLSKAFALYIKEFFGIYLNTVSLRIVDMTNITIEKYIMNLPCF